MLGILDSGKGGENTAREIRRQRPDVDIMLYLDREHAPYGERREDELIPLVEGGISSLCEAGVDRVLLACCTASSIYDRLSASARRVALPIIEPVANMARLMANGGKIALIATERTIASGEFRRYLGENLAISIPAPRLVRLIDEGASDTHRGEEISDYLEELLLPISESGASLLILRCTHFSSLRGEIQGALDKITKRKILIADSAKIAARALLESGTAREGVGRLMRL